MNIATLFILLLGPHTKTEEMLFISTAHTETEEENPEAENKVSTESPEQGATCGPKPSTPTTFRRPAPLTQHNKAVDGNNILDASCWVMRNTDGITVRLIKVKHSANDKPQVPNGFPCHTTVLASSTHKLVTQIPLPAGHWKLYADCFQLGVLSDTKLECIVCDYNQLRAFSQLTPDQWKYAFHKQGEWQLETTTQTSERFDVHHKCTLTCEEILKGPKWFHIYPLNNFSGVEVQSESTITENNDGTQVMHTENTVGDSDQTERPQLAKKKDLKWLLDTGHVVIIQVDLMTTSKDTQVFTDWECCICKEPTKEKVAVLQPCGHTLCCKCVKLVKDCPQCRAAIETFVTATNFANPETEDGRKVGQKQAMVKDTDDESCQKQPRVDPGTIPCQQADQTAIKQELRRLGASFHDCVEKHEFESRLVEAKWQEVVSFFVEHDFEELEAVYICHEMDIQKKSDLDKLNTLHFTSKLRDADQENFLSPLEDVIAKCVAVVAAYRRHQ